MDNVAADFNSALAALAVNENVKQTPPSHLDALLADEARTVGAGNEAVLHHKDRERTGRAAGGGILDDPELRREHARVRAVPSRREHENGRRFFARANQIGESSVVDPCLVDRRPIFDGNENQRIAGRKQFAVNAG